jgi:hypothetical protein
MKNELKRLYGRFFYCSFVKILLVRYNELERKGII